MAATMGGIEFFIELANACPSGYKPLDLEQQGPFNSRQLKEYLAEELKASDELKRNSRYAKCNAFELKEHLRFLWGVKNTLSKIVSAIRPRRAHELRLVPVDMGTTTGHWIIVGRDGNMNVIASQDHQEFSDALKATNARRIRKCYCGKFFYARRTTRRFHTDNCRVARWADTHFEEWNRIQERHKEKRANKRALEKAKKGKNRPHRKVKPTPQLGQAPHRAVKPGRANPRPAKRRPRAKTKH